MTGWDLLPRIVLLLGAAALLGLLLRRLRQSVIVGYLLAGILLGPTGLGVLRTGEDVQLLSELGVALLLFSIGLEFSFARLREFGRVAVGGGSFQMLLTAAVVITFAILLLNLAGVEAAVLGMAFAMSSTAVVMRGLTDRAELDSTHGRNAIGMLLLQDIAVIPILIATDALGGSSGPAAVARQFGLRIGMVVLFIAAAWLLARLVLPAILSAAARSGSRDLPVVVAVCTTIGAAWAAHSMGFSPSLGAFLAGLVLAESPFATQIRADVTPLSAVFVTLFFAAVGTSVRLPLDPTQLALLAVAAVATMTVKALITAGSVWVWQRSVRTALLTGLVISQVGEFTFVVVESGHRRGIVSEEVFQFTLGISLITLVLTPYVMNTAPMLVTRIMRRLPGRIRGVLESDRPAKRWRRVLVIGFGPAGQQVVARLLEKKIPFLVLEMNPNTVSEYRSQFSIELGDATQREVLQHVGIGQSLSLIITIPDPATARLICSAAQRLAPGIPVVARSRYHQYKASLEQAGAHKVVDEEYFVGVKLADEAIESLRPLEG
jgi:monovalent cation:H+ antiporter-2, CPA2 family